MLRLSCSLLHRLNPQELLQITRENWFCLCSWLWLAPFIFLAYIWRPAALHAIECVSSNSLTACRLGAQKWPQWCVGPGSRATWSRFCKFPSSFRFGAIMLVIWYRSWWEFLHLGNQQSYILGAPPFRSDCNHTPGHHCNLNILTFSSKICPGWYSAPSRYSKTFD